MRGPAQRAADLRAQLAANRLAARRLEELADRHGDDGARAARWRRCCCYAERRTRASIAAMPDGRYRATDVLEDDGGGEPRDLTHRVRGAHRGRSRSRSTSPAPTRRATGNLNCPLSVTKSAVYYVVRVLTDPDIPPSAGAYRPVHVTAPAGTRRQRAAARRGRRRQRRDLEPHRGRHAGRARPGGARARRRPGHDEQPDARQRAVHLLRDDGRRPGRLPGRGRPVRRARRDEQHAQHADRGARGRVPAAGHASTRCGAGRAAPGVTAAATGSCARSRRSSR